MWVGKEDNLGLGMPREDYLQLPGVEQTKVVLEAAQKKRWAPVGAPEGFVLPVGPEKVFAALRLYVVMEMKDATVLKAVQPIL